MGWMDLVRRLKDVVGLTDEQLAALERRRVLRVHKRVPIVAVRTNGEQVHMIAIDFGPQGMRAELAKRLQKDEMLRVYCSRSAPDLARQLARGDASGAPVARVVWTKSLKEKLSHLAGLAFSTRDETEQRAAARFLLEECEVSLAEGRENRMAPRVPLELEARLLRPPRETIHAIVRDIAVGGALVEVSRPLARHTMLEVEVDLPDQGAPLRCKGLVVRCVTRDEDEYELGIAFTVVPENHKERLVALLTRKLLAQEGL